jgi:hypothetical protein
MPAPVRQPQPKLTELPTRAVPDLRRRLQHRALISCARRVLCKSPTDPTIRLRDGRQLGYAERAIPGAGRLPTSTAGPDRGSRALGRRGGRGERRPVDCPRPAGNWPLGLSAAPHPRGPARRRGSGGSGPRAGPFRGAGDLPWGPYAAACAWKLAKRLTGAGILSGLAPVDFPAALAGMGRRNHVILRLVGRLAVLRRPDRILERGVAAAVDKKHLDRPDVRAILVESLSEALRNGSRGPAWEMGLYARPWGSPRGHPGAGAPVARGAGRQRSGHHGTRSGYCHSHVPGQFLLRRGPSSLREPPAGDPRRDVSLLDWLREGRNDVAEDPPPGTRSGTVDRWPTRHSRVCLSGFKSYVHRLPGAHCVVPIDPSLPPSFLPPSFAGSTEDEDLTTSLAPGPEITSDVGRPL